MQTWSLTLVEKGKSPYTIVRPLNSTQEEIQASNILQNYIKLISGVLIPVTVDQVPESQFEILIGKTSRSLNMDLNQVSLEGFLIETHAGKLIIYGKGRGALFGVYAFLEDYLGCKKYSSKFKFIPLLNTITIPDIKDLQNPQLDFRSLHYWDAETDQEYLDWHKLHRIDDKWGLWGHSFFKLVPPQQYFSEHPEYFGLVNGRRKAMQLCLTNPDVLKIVTGNLRQKINEQPELQFWSVSQNDDIGACECQDCSALNSKYKSQQGSLLTFVNQVATNFPDKTISTLAYNYTRVPPQGLLPLKNVNILFSSIQINRSKPVETDPRSEAFRKEYEDWQKLTANIILWDYVVQFTNYFSPFPNLHILKPNFSYFSKNKPSGFFIQGSVEVPGEFAELRTYILSKLLWNHNADADELKTEFLNAYYGKAAVYVAGYIDRINENVQKSWKRMDIYDNPIMPYTSYLSNEMLREYISILDKAAAAVKDEPEYYRRVQIAALPVHFAFLQQARFYGIEQNGVFSLEAKKWVVRSEIRTKVQDFVKVLKELGISQMNEGGLSPDSYASDWEQIFESGPTIHKALNKPIRLLTENNNEFVSKGPKTLLDAIKGNHDFQYNWLGWNGNDMSVLIDMEKRTRISKVSLSFLENHRYYIFLPIEILVEISVDGIEYKKVAKIKNAVPVELVPGSIKQFILDFEETPSRYVKVTAIHLPELPEWRKREDRKPWLLIDEIRVD